MEEKLKEKNIKITLQRIELIRTLEELKDVHPSFNEVYKSIQSTHPSVSRSTVHENLKLLVELGIIKSFHYKGEIRYEMNLEPHVNLADSNGVIKDITNDKILKHVEEIVKIMKEDEKKDITALLVLME